MIPNIIYKTPITVRKINFSLIIMFREYCIKKEAPVTRTDTS